MCDDVRALSASFQSSALRIDRGVLIERLARHAHQRSGLFDRRHGPPDLFAEPSCAIEDLEVGRLSGPDMVLESHAEMASALEREASDLVLQDVAAREGDVQILLGR